MPPRPFEFDSTKPNPVVGELLMPDDDVKPQSPENAARWLRFLASMMDTVIEVPGTKWRIGFDPIIGLVPIVGDLASAAVSLYILAAAAHMQIPRSTLLRMGLNIGIDYCVGAIPLFGNVFDFVWKANDRNIKLLERTLAAPPAERQRQGIWDWLLIAGIIALLLAIFIGSIVFAVLIAGWIAHILGWS